MNLSKYNLENLKRVTNIDGLTGIASKFGTDLNKKYHAVAGPPDGVEVMEEDWDNLIILDGCRFDLFESVVEERAMDGTLEQRRSRASHSRGFILENFTGRELHDTVYVSANPFSRTIPDGTFHYLRSLLSEEWDSELQTVPPRAVAEAALDASQCFPQKRLIVHFMQPHYPFIGARGRKIEESGLDPVALDIESNEPVKDSTTDSAGTPIWRRLQYGLGVTRQEVLDAYRENLNIVLDTVEELVEQLDGKAVITSDHGNLIGDRQWPIPVQGYGHPQNLYVDGLIEVPWLLLDGERQDTIPDIPVDGNRINEDDLEERLDALGYR